MLTLPENVDRPAQDYAFITFVVTMDDMQTPATSGFPAVYAALAKQGITPVGAPFYNYRRIDMSSTLDVEAGVPVVRRGAAEGQVQFGVLPAGRFVTLTWHGHPDRLEPVTGMLIGWLKQSGQSLDMEERADGDHFACRLEIYETNPDLEPDLDKWQTELAFKLKD